MTKASPAEFAGAKRQALRAFSQQMPDGFVPDRIMFFNDDLGFMFRISDLGEDNHLQRIVPWSQVALAKVDIIERTVSLAVEKLARAQFSE